jgi:hypothetical protein
MNTEYVSARVHGYDESLEYLHNTQAILHECNSVDLEHHEEVVFT